MHRIVEEGLEDYLSGRSTRDFTLHLEGCPPCRLEIAEFESVSVMFRESFHPAVLEAEVPAPSPAFYARLSQSLDESRQSRKADSFWNLFAINAAFGRRVAFGSLMTLALVGGYLISRESGIAPDLQGPEAIMASHDAAAPHNDSVERDRMMVTLASYEH